MKLTLEAVLALSPDDASAKAARGLVAPAKWPLLGASDAAVWGECQGSGSKPYQTQVDLSGPAFRCSCPSRKFPCKHGLALLMLQAQDASRFTSTEPPAWVTEWLASRGEKAQKKEEREREKAAVPVDPQAAARREGQRWKRIEEAVSELQRWLCDQVARGLGALDAESLKGWHTMAARMVDAQAPLLGTRLLEAARDVGTDPAWPERMLERLGLLRLLCEAVQRRAGLTASLRADLQTALGWPQDKTEVMAEGEALADRWTVLGVATEERDDKLTERRVWLHGQRSGRRAWLLDHAFGGRGFEQAWLTGTSIDTTLRFFPGAAALRALAAEGVLAPQAPEWPNAGLDSEWERIADRLAACPWSVLHPLVLPQAVVIRVAASTLAVVGDRALPLSIDDSDRWTLLASTGGRPCQLMGEWNGRALKPLTAWNGAGTPQWQRSGT